MESRPPPAVPRPPGKKFKRPRASQACERCRSKKYKCDEEYPCVHCKRHAVECVYQRAHHPARDNSSYIQSLENKIQELTALLNKQNAAADSIARVSPGPDSVRSQPVIQSNSFESCSPIYTTDTYTCPMSPKSFQLEPQDRSPHDNSDLDGEISEVNKHTDSIEFHGTTSSISVLESVQKRNINRKSPNLEPTGNTENTSLISTLHNCAFSSRTWIAREEGNMQEHRYYFRPARVFIEGYFESLHFMHPFIDKSYFLSRAHDLWFRPEVRPQPTFVAFYLALLSIGALVRVWDEPTIEGMGRFEWSRKLFKEAEIYLHTRRFHNDLDTVHCLFLMVCRSMLLINALSGIPKTHWYLTRLQTKVCQNELNPHLAYMHLGQAIRTCLSAGFNREPTDDRKREGEVVSTWWGLYSLDIEMSFSLGRPDTLGLDEYHNRRLPDVDNTEYAIIPCMVDFGRIIRKVAVRIYHSRISLQQKFLTALEIENDMNEWVSRLPPNIQPSLGLDDTKNGELREPKWCRRQRLVLGIRYHNVRMLLFRPFVAHSTRNHGTPFSITDGVTSCVDSAQKTIQMIHDTFKTQTFFQTWWYNTTYVLFAASILLLLLNTNTTTIDLRRPLLLKSVGMAVEILEAMDESFVAKKLAELISQNLQDAKEATTEVSSVAEHPIPNWYTMQIPNSEQNPEFDFSDYRFEGLGSIFDDLSNLSSASFNVQTDS